MELEELFSSKLRMKILKLLYELGALNVSDVARRLGSNFAATANHLKILAAEEILQERSYGRVRMYSFNEASGRAKAVKNLIDVWEEKS